MTPARSLAASVVALGFAGTLTGSPPAAAAPSPCERAESYAAQSGAELLRVDRLTVRAAGAERPAVPGREEAASRSRTSGGDAAPTDPTAESGEDADTISEGAGIAGQALLGQILPGGTALLARDSRSAGSPLRDKTLEATGADADTVVRGVGLGEARTALVGTSRINSAAVARILDGRADGKAAWTGPLLQQAPPTSGRAATRSTPSGHAGPLDAGRGQVVARARWEAGMACGRVAGEAARASASMRGAGILSGRDWALVRVPGQITSLSTTALERHDGRARTVASATVAAGSIELAGGKVRVRVLRPPSLVASMSVDGYGEVRYRPPVVEVSGDGIATSRLTTAGDHVDVSLGPERQAMESGLLGPAGLGEVGPGAELPLPRVPGLPKIGDPATESAPAAGSRLRITLGTVRQASKGHAIAALATAIKMTVTLGAASGGRGTGGYGGEPRRPVSLDLGVGLLEAAAVAPERAAGGTSGAAGGLPITGPNVVGLAAAGAGLLLAGTATMLLGRLRRRDHTAEPDKARS